MRAPAFPGFPLALAQAPGYDADIVAFDADGQVVRTWTRGALAYERERVAERAVAKRI